MYTFVWLSGAIWETPSKKMAVFLSHLYVIGVKIVLRVLVPIKFKFYMFYRSEIPLLTILLVVYMIADPLQSSGLHDRGSSPE